MNETSRSVRMIAVACSLASLAVACTPGLGGTANGWIIFGFLTLVALLLHLEAWGIDHA